MLKQNTNEKIIFAFLILFSTLGFSQEKTDLTSFNKKEIIINPIINGSLYSPLKQNKKTNLIILIAGSGPTDRDGNQKGLTNNSLKYLSEELSKMTCVFSYDKRIIAQMKTEP